MVNALIIAGGSSSRTGLKTPKQFVEVNGKPIIIHTLEKFQAHPEVDAITIVSLKGWEETVKKLCRQYNITKLISSSTGGASGQESIFLGIKDIEKHCSGEEIVIIHEAVRPLVSHSIITDSLRVCREYGGAVASQPCHDAMFLFHGDVVSGQISREKLIKTQNPHTFPLSKLIWAHEEAAKRGIINSVATSTLMVELGETFHLSKGSEKNFKLTTYEDIEIFKALLDVGKIM